MQMSSHAVTPVLMRLEHSFTLTSPLRPSLFLQIRHIPREMAERGAISLSRSKVAQLMGKVGAHARVHVHV